MTVALWTGLGLGFLVAAQVGPIWPLCARTLWSAFRVRAGAETQAELASPLRALRVSLAATASNPLTIASWGAVFATASAASVATNTATTSAMLAGIGVGSFAWFSILSLAITALRRRIGQRVMSSCWSMR